MGLHERRALRRRRVRSRAVRLVVTALVVTVAPLAGAMVGVTAAGAAEPLPLPTYDAAAVANPTATVSAGGVPMGGTPGGLSVDDTGTARYQIPLKVVPGRGGFQPTLSLSYRSDGGNGQVGTGFALSGLSQVSRCDRTAADDGVAEAVGLTAADRFCLNGLKLVAVSGAYGADGTEYRTKPDTHVRVRSHRTATAGPAGPTHFTVWTADGQVQHYGAGGAEAVQVNTSTPPASAYVTWPITRAENRSGNVITYEYAERTTAGPNELERYPTAIRYGHGTKLDRLVALGWETRPDKRFGYAYGAKRESTQRLRSITMSIDAGGLKRARGYTLAYQTAPTTGASRLTGVTECGSVPTECLRPTTFEWWDGAAGFRPGATQAGNGGQSLIPPAADVRVVAADYNGDGRTDLAWPEGTDGSAPEPKVWKYLHAEFDGAYRQVRTGPTNFHGRKATAYPIDYDLDGRVDLMPRMAQITSYGPVLSRAHFVFKKASTPFYGGFNQVTDTIQLAGGMVGDFDGDGFQDLLEYRRTLGGTDIRWSWRKRTGTVSPSIDDAEPTDDQAFGEQQTIAEMANLRPDDVQVVDLTGDGRDEILYVKTNTVLVHDVLGQAPTFDWQSFYQPLKYLDVKLLDVNGDGLTDAVTNGVNLGKLDELYYWINDGRRFLPAVRANVGLTAAALPLSEVVDYDGDGRHELLVPRQGSGAGQYVGLDVVKADFDTATPTFSRTATEVSFNPVTLETMGAQGTRLVDADGDGQQDVLLVDRGGATGPALRAFLHNGGSAGTKPDLLRRVREGTAHPVEGATLPPTAEIDYGPLSDNTVHFGGDCPRQPQATCTTGGMHVVKQVGVDAGRPNSTARLVSTYFYQRARVAKKGQAFLGFAERRVTTRSTVPGHQPVTEKTFYSNEVPGKDPRPVERWAYADLPGGQQSLQRTGLAYATKATVAGLSFDYVARTSARSYQIPAYCCLASLTPAGLDGLGHQPYRGATDRTESVDAYGNTLVSTRVTSGNGIASTHVASTVDVDPTNWLLRRPRKVVTRDGPGDYESDTWDPATRTTETTYVPGTDRVDGQRSYRTDTVRGQELSTAYQYDAEGNVVRTTVTDVKSGTVRETTAGYDPYGYPHATMNALGHVSRTGYDPVAGTLKVAVDVNGLRVDNTYDSLGRPVRTRQPSGAESTVSYALETRGSEQLIRVERTDGTGATSQTVSDRSGRPVAERVKGLDGVLRVKDLEYEPEGRLSSETVLRRAGTTATERVTYTYDDTGRMLTRTEPGNAVRSWSYSGLDVTETDPRGNKVRSTKNARGLPTAVVDGLGSARETRRTYGYGSFDALVRTAVDGVAASASTYVHDERNNVLSAVEPGQGTSTATYNAFGEQLTSRDAMSREATSAYDALGRLVERTVRRNGVLHSVQRNHWDVNASKTRARKGLLLETVRTDEITGGAQTAVAYEYDTLSRVTRTVHRLPSERDPAEPETFAVGTEYDAFGRTTAVRYPTLPGAPAGTKVGYTYSTTNGQLTGARVLEPAAEARTLWTAKATDDQNRLVHEESGDGVAGRRELDWRGAVLTQEFRTSTTDTGGERVLLHQRHGYDQVGNLRNTRRTDATQQYTDETFGYDELDRVTEARVTYVDPCADNSCRVTGGAGSRVPTWTGAVAASGPGDPPPPPPTTQYVADTWAYDKLGNLTASKRRGTYTYDATKPYQATAVSGGIFGDRAYGYDLAGNQTVRPGATLTYTDRNLPARILPTAGGPATSFVYWPDGQRARKAAGTDVVTTVPGGYERHRKGDRVEHRLLVRAGGRVVATIGYTAGGTGAPAAEPPQYVHADRLGSTSLVTADADAGTGVRAAVREERSYDAYGLPRNPDLRARDDGYTSGIAPTTVDQGYTGHEEDRELGLVDMGGRVYDPTLARFLTPDPLVSGSNATQAWNRYAYVSGNPLRHTDPSGFEECFGCPENDVWGPNGATGHEALGDFFLDSAAFADGGTWGIDPTNSASPSANRLERYGEWHSGRVQDRMKQLDRIERAAKAAQVAKQQAEQRAKQAEALKRYKLWINSLLENDELSGQDAISGPLLAANDVCQPGECDSNVAADFGSCPSGTSCVGPLVSEDPGYSDAGLAGTDGGTAGAGGASGAGDLTDGAGGAPGFSPNEQDAGLLPGTFVFAGVAPHYEAPGAHVGVSSELVGYVSRDSAGDYSWGVLGAAGLTLGTFHGSIGMEWDSQHGLDGLTITEQEFGPFSIGGIATSSGHRSNFGAFNPGIFTVGGGWEMP